MRDDGMCAYNAVSPNNDVILRGDYHAAVAEPAILLDQYPPSRSKPLVRDRLIHIRIFVVVVSDEYTRSHQYFFLKVNLIHRGYHGPAPHPAAPANNDSGFRTVWNDRDVQPHVTM